MTPVGLLLILALGCVGGAIVADTQHLPGLATCLMITHVILVALAAVAAIFQPTRK